MDKDKLRRRLIALGVAGTLMLVSGCSNTNSNSNTNANSNIPKNYGVPSQYDNFSDYYEIGIRNGEKTKLYKRDYIWILFDKETLEAHKYIYLDTTDKYLGKIEMYDLETGEMLFYGREAGLIMFADYYNYDYANYLIKHGYDMGFKDLENYIEGIDKKDNYSIEEIDELIPALRDACKKINNISKNKQLEKKI